MNITFVPKQGEVSVQIEFAQPSFALFADVLQLGHSLWKRLSPLGLRLADMKFEGGNTTYNEAHVQCFLYNYTAELNVRPDRIDVKSFDTTRHRDAFAVITAATLAARERAPDAMLRSCTSVSAIHGSVVEGDTRLFINRFVHGVPEAAGKQLGTGVVFYFEPQDTQLASSLTFEPSLSVEGGLFIRTTTLWNIENGDLATLSESDAKYSERLLDAFSVRVQQ